MTSAWLNQCPEGVGDLPTILALLGGYPSIDQLDFTVGYHQWIGFRDFVLPSGKLTYLLNMAREIDEIVDLPMKEMLLLNGFLWLFTRG